MALQPASDEVMVVNAPSSAIGDLYHAVLRASWPATLIGIALVVVLLNVIFGVAYLAVGGVANMQPGSFADAFFFSVQTSGTIGYGGMVPVSRAANAIVTVEATVSVLVTALSTGLVFAKFSMPTARIEFTRELTIFTMDGEPTLAFRVANTRGNFVVEAQIRLSMIRTELSAEGIKMYRMHDLKLVRDRSPAMGRGWTVLHRLNDGILRGATPESLKRDEVEVIASVVGIDGTSMQTIHARHRWTDAAVKFGVRHADMLSELPDGRVQLDYAKFHDLVKAA